MFGWEAGMAATWQLRCLLWVAKERWHSLLSPFSRWNQCFTTFSRLKRKYKRRFYLGDDSLGGGSFFMSYISGRETSFF